MQAYEGYFEDGQFYPIGQPVSIRGRRRVVMTVLEDSAAVQTETQQAKAWREFFDAVNASGEEVPKSFERVKFVREVDA